MLTVLLLILKIIGFLLLAILLLLLLILLVVLLCPVRYELEGEKKGCFSGYGKVSWLFGLLKAEGKWKEGKDPRFRILVAGRSLTEKKKKKKRKKTSAKEPEILYTREKQTPEKQPEEDPVKTEAAEPPRTETPEPVPKPMAEETPQEKSAEKKAVPERKYEGIRRVKMSQIREVPPPEPLPEEDFLEDEAFFTGKEPEEAEEGFDWKLFLKIEDKKGIAKAFAKLLKRMAKGILPRDFFLVGTFGTGDPVWTGYLLAALGIWKGKFGENLQVRGDFAKRTAEDVTVRIGGKIVAGYLVYAGAAFVLAKPVRRVLMTLWKGRKKNGEGI
ncbi:hypothetical protein H9X85_05240 [Anaerotignum lactatifermentans]|uniref:DUF2953 domain-containing protein n=1 Tax=Anaerotignum lactatifermentans TaxID=160404 RepID=A0ABS2G6Z6_9FIRM|nr:hypothetical protein [Anaerotignum lactatifermentans]MBM6829148.1 hypothetical protein [Anaerotignum lactatifermentans]MBM6877244.1 hypothetical protein [Anaerotignum lactatifermentans]MBM6950617.1 hypothetical protein [Anaerotignum lactatifermentans]